MLAQRADRFDGQPSFSRRDLGRLLGASAVLILALTAIFVIDIVPSRVSVSAGDIASADILAPRAITYTSALQTQAAQDAARAAVSPQYDFSPGQAAATARQQAAAFNLLVAPVDTAFDPGTSEKDRLAVLETALPGLSDESRANLLALPLARWPTIRSQAAAILDQLESTELRDSQIADLRARLQGMILGGLNDAERKLAAEIVAPLLVPNSSFSQTLTDVEKAKAAGKVAPVTVTLSQGQSIVRKGDRVSADMVEQIDAFGQEVAPLINA